MNINAGPYNTMPVTVALDIAQNALCNAVSNFAHFPLTVQWIAPALLLLEC
jgi:hypothetical protein